MRGLLVTTISISFLSFATLLNAQTNPTSVKRSYSGGSASQDQIIIAKPAAAAKTPAVVDTMHARAKLDPASGVKAETKSKVQLVPRSRSGGNGSSDYIKVKSE